MRPLILDGHDHLGRLLADVAAKRAPRTEHQRLELLLSVGDRWQAELAGVPPWEVDSPLADRQLQAAIRQLRELGLQVLPTADDGSLVGPSAAASGLLQQLAQSIGRQLAETVLTLSKRSSDADPVLADAWSFIHNEQTRSGKGS